MTIRKLHDIQAPGTTGTGGGKEYKTYSGTKIKSVQEIIERIERNIPLHMNPYNLGDMGETTELILLLINNIKSFPTHTPSSPPVPDKMTFKEMLTGLFDVSFLSSDELKTISDAGEMYANGCFKNAGVRPSGLVEKWQKQKDKFIKWKDSAHEQDRNDRAEMYYELETVTDLFLSDLKSQTVKEDWISVEEVVAERKRQIEVEKYDYKHDESYSHGELIGAAACYAVSALNKLGVKARVQIYKEAELDFLVNNGDRGDRRLQPAKWVDAWPWDKQYDKREKHDTRRSLVIAAALLIAELDTLPTPPNK